MIQNTDTDTLTTPTRTRGVMRALVLAVLLASSCTYTYQRTAPKSHAALYTAWGLDLAGAAASLVVMDQVAFPIESQPARIAVMSGLAGAFFLYALSAKSGMAPSRPATMNDCIAEWDRLHSFTHPGDDLANRYPRTLPCEMD